MSKLYEILNKIIPTDNQHYVEQKKLLWENTTPSVAFSAQDVTITGIQASDDIEFVFRDENHDYTQRISNGGKLLCAGGSIYPTEVWTRGITVAANKITFSNAYFHSIGSTNTGQNNARVIPLKAFIIKKLGA